MHFILLFNNSWLVTVYLSKLCFLFNVEDRHFEIFPRLLLFNKPGLYFHRSRFKTQCLQQHYIRKKFESLHTYSFQKKTMISVVNTYVLTYNIYLPKTVLLLKSIVFLQYWHVHSYYFLCTKLMCSLQL